MTNVNGINYAQQAVPMTAQRVYTQPATPQPVTAPYQNDAFVSSAKQEKKSKHVVGKLLLTGALVVGGSVAARKFTGLKDYTKVVENATGKQKAANIITTIADKAIEYGKKALEIGKTGFEKSKEAVTNILKKGDK